MPRDLYEQTASLDDLVAALQTVSPGVRLDVKQPRYFRWRARFLATPHLQIWRTQTNAEWKCTAEQSAARFYVILPSQGTLETAVRGQTYVSEEGRHALVLTDPDALELYGHGAPESGQINFKWQPSAIQDVLAQIYDQKGERSLLSPSFDLGSKEGQLFHFLARGLVAGHFQEIGGSPNASALISETMLRLLVEGSTMDTVLSRAPATASSGQVRAAIDLMYERLHEPLTLGILATTLGISGRSLQQGFRKYHATTPLTYLRNLRLEAFHRELSDPRNTLSVGDVAGKWGFAHVGRLAKLYRAAYGRAPSETMRLIQRRR
jgi:AraC-like DNA-binding protein